MCIDNNKDIELTDDELEYLCENYRFTEAQKNSDVIANGCNDEFYNNFWDREDYLRALLLEKLKSNRHRPYLRFFQTRLHSYYIPTNIANVIVFHKCRFRDIQTI